MNRNPIIAIAFVLLLPALLQAQPESPVHSTDAAVPPYGSGEQTALQYAGVQTPSNTITLDTGYEGAYDDNVLGATGARRQGDQVHDLSANISILRQTPQMNLLLEYMPFYEFLGRFSQYNRFDQHLSADASFNLGQHWSLRIRDVFDDQMSSYRSGLSSLAASGLGSPSTLNTSIYVPFVDQQSNSSRVDLSWQGNTRNSAFLFGGYEFRNFSGTPSKSVSLLDTRGESAGAEYDWRAREHLTVGLLYLFQRLDFLGTPPVGSPTRLDVHSAYPSIGMRLRPTVQVTAFAGPQFVSATASSAPWPYGVPVVSNQIEWSAGGTLSRQTDKSSWSVSAQRMVSDGGGFFSFVISTNYSAGLRYMLPLQSRWDATWNVGIAQNHALSIGNTTADLYSQGASFGLEHPLRDNVMTRLSYDFINQSGTGSLPVGSDFHRNRVSLGIYFRWTGVPMGR